MIFSRVAELIKPLEKKGFTIDFNLLENPKEHNMGDVSLPCFNFAKILKKSPIQIAKKITKEINVYILNHPSIDKVIATGPYVNFFLKSERLGKNILPKIETQGILYGSSKTKNETIVIESPGPNTNKPLHLGHVRNMLLGNSLALLSSFSGYTTKKVDIVNDRGIHICKSMLAYQLRGNNANPNKKSDHYVGDWYVRYDIESKKDPSLENKIQTMLKQRESSDKKVRTLRKKMRHWALEGMNATYKIYNCHIDKTYYESDHYLKGRKLVEQGIKQGVFIKNKKGNIVFQSKNEEKTVLRSDGTAIYMTQDIALGKLRYSDRKMDRMIYVVGSEQEHHFIFLFKIFKALGFTFAKKCFHMSYGMISLPDGKMKSREGNVVDADTLIENLTKECQIMLTKRHPGRAINVLKKTAKQIAIGAIKFFILKYDAKKDFIFNSKQSLSFDGESGPYIQYTIARCNSILTKSTKKIEPGEIQYTSLKENEERILLILLSKFQSTIKKASNTYQPYLVARYVLELSKTFNTYYQKHKIITENKQHTLARLSLVIGIKQVLENGLRLLGIESPEKM